MVNKLNCGLPGWFSWIGSSFWGFWKDWFSPYIPPNPSSSDLVAYPSPNEWDIKFLFPHIRNNKFQTLIKKFNLQLKKLQYIYEMDNGLEKKKKTLPSFLIWVQALLDLVPVLLTLRLGWHTCDLPESDSRRFLLWQRYWKQSWWIRSS